MSENEIRPKKRFSLVLAQYNVLSLQSAPGNFSMNHANYGGMVLRTVIRQPFAILGAIGFVSMLKGVMTLHEDIDFVIGAYQSITQPIWDFLLGWLFRLLNWPFPWWLKDYLTLGAICAGASTRQPDAYFQPNIDFSFSLTIAARKFLIILFLWPIYVIRMLPLLHQPSEEEIQNYVEYQFIMQNEHREYLGLEIDKDFDPDALPGTEAHDRNAETRAQFRESFLWRSQRNRQVALIFFEFLLWAAIIIAASYTLFVVAP